MKEREGTSKFGIGILAVVAVIGLVLGYAGAAFTAHPAARSPVAMAPTLTPANVSLVVEGHLGGSLGSDNKTHDTFIPANFTVYAGQTVYLTVRNYDEGPHTFTSAGLGVSFQIPGRVAAGVPSVSHFSFTAPKAGVYRWDCIVPCDDGAGGWAMTTSTDGQPDQVGFMAGFVTVVPPPAA